VKQPAAVRAMVKQPAWACGFRPPGVSQALN